MAEFELMLVLRQKTYLLDFSVIFFIIQQDRNQRVIRFTPILEVP